MKPEDELVSNSDSYVFTETDQVSGATWHAYRSAGLRLRSDLELPGLIAIAPSAATDIIIAEGDVPECVAEARMIGPHWQMAADRFVIDLPDIVRMMMIGGRELRYQIAPGASREEAAIFVIGTGFGILLHQRGSIVLHASAVRVGERAVLFCGASGAGKSTLAAALGEAGYQLIADDLCAIELAGSAAPRVHPDGRRHRLWHDATVALGVQDRRGAAVRDAIAKFYVEPRAGSAAALPVAAIYALREARPPWTPGVHAPNRVDAALIIRRNAYRPLLVREMGQTALYFDAALQLVRSSGISILARPLDFATLPGVVASLEEHWRAVGIAREQS